MRRRGERLSSAAGTRWQRLPKVSGLRLQGTYAIAARTAEPVWITFGSDTTFWDQGVIRHAANLEVLRSEEHTSELQSPCNLVCRLLLEKKKTRPHQAHPGPRGLRPADTPRHSVHVEIPHRQGLPAVSRLQGPLLYQLLPDQRDRRLNVI